MTLLAGFCFFIAAQEPLLEPVAVAWRPKEGWYAVLAQGGRELRVLDAELRPLGARGLDTAYRDIAADAGGWLLQDSSGGVAWLSALDAVPLRFSSPPGAEIFPGEAAARRGPAGRRLLLDRERGRLQLGLAEWEHAGELEWGPGWATLRLRVAEVIGPFAEWRCNGAAIQQAPVTPDRDDPLRQRASFEPLRPGDVLELRYHPPTSRYPAAEWTPWLRYEAPAVDPGGPHPITVLRQDL